MEIERRGRGKRKCERKNRVDVKVKEAGSLGKGWERKLTKVLESR
jgi:hypothetical protein